MHLNFLAIVVAALIPNIIGFIWYNPKVFGNAWMKETGLTFDPETARKGMFKILIISLILCFMIAFYMTMSGAVIHQMGLFSLLDGNKEAGELLKQNVIPQIKMGEHAYDIIDNFRTFKHGALHGTILGIFVLMPVIAISSMYEKRSWKYVLISSGYWIVNLIIMGGIICGWK